MCAPPVVKNPHDPRCGLNERLSDPPEGVLGRFISRDPIGHRGNLNLYAYPTNPVSFVDPSGLDPNTCLFGSGTGGAPKHDGSQFQGKFDVLNEPSLTPSRFRELAPRAEELLSISAHQPEGNASSKYLKLYSDGVLGNFGAAESIKLSEVFELNNAKICVIGGCRTLNEDDLLYDCSGRAVGGWGDKVSKLNQTLFFNEFYDLLASGETVYDARDFAIQNLQQGSKFEKAAADFAQQNFHLRGDPNARLSPRLFPNI